MKGASLDWPAMSSWQMQRFSDLATETMASRGPRQYGMPQSGIKLGSLFGYIWAFQSDRRKKKRASRRSTAVGGSLSHGSLMRELERSRNEARDWNATAPAEDWAPRAPAESLHGPSSFRNLLSFPRMAWMELTCPWTEALAILSSRTRRFEHARCSAPLSATCLATHHGSHAVCWGLPLYTTPLGTFDDQSGRWWVSPRNCLHLSSLNDHLWPYGSRSPWTHAKLIRVCLRLPC